MKNISAIVLAAGESKRMGSPKMLLPFNDRTIIETVLDNVIAAGIEDVIVVLGADMRKIKMVLEKYPIRHCYNDNYRAGMFSSVKCGFAILPAGCNAALVIPGDQPQIAPREISRVVEACHVSGKGLVMPVCNGKRGHPLVVAVRYFEEVKNMSDEGGLRRLSILHPDDVYEVQTNDPGVLHDIDTREDYLLAINKI
jgi:molybdenum cofactor cytidylyltransferase